MEIMEEETLCGPLCQHPTCWTSARRKARNIPHRVVPLPKAKVKKEVVQSARSLPDDLEECKSGDVLLCLEYIYSWYGHWGC